MQNESMIIEFFSDFIKFRNTSIKFYFDDDDNFVDDSIFITSTNSINLSSNEFNIFDIRDHLSTSFATASIISTSIKRDRERSRKHFVQINFNSDICFVMSEDLHDFDDEGNDEHNSVYTITSIQGTHTAVQGTHTASFSNEGDAVWLIRKEEKLKKKKDENYIYPENGFQLKKSPQLFQYIASRQKEIAGLLKKNVFYVIDFNQISIDVRVFNSRFVNEIKNSKIDKIFEKFKLIVQTYNDLNKDLIFTQSSTIQRMSQRLIVCLAVCMQDDTTKLYFKNITQVYVQSIFNLNRDFYIRSFIELINLLNVFINCILKIVKLLYDVSKTDNHWFAIYHVHHKKKLDMIEFTYDACLLHWFYFFEIIEMQTNDILMLINDAFANMKKETIKSIKLMIKNRDYFIAKRFIKFNETQIKFDENDIVLIKKTHVSEFFLIIDQNVEFINAKDITRIKLSLKKQYVAQQIRRIYMISICQSEISFDFFYAAQIIKYIDNNVISLNKRLQWQVNNKSRDLKFVKLNINILQLIVFIDSFFVNNKNLFSQIDYVICLANAINKINVMHWSSIKCKKMTRSVLTIELYAMAHDFDLGAVVKTTLVNVLKTNIFFIFCIDFKSLYDCLIKLSTTQKKRLMIDVMSLRQSYEKREITKMKWINDLHNPVDFMTKIKSSSTLKTLIDINRINLTVIEWIEKNNFQLPK